MKSYNLSKREIHRILQSVAATWPREALIEKTDEIRMTEIDAETRLLKIQSTFAVVLEERIVPFLRATSILDAFPSISVDSGAIVPLCNGADIMRPGILEFRGTFHSGDIVAVRESTYGKYIAVGLALKNSDEAEVLAKGAILKNLHYVGDKSWEAYKAL